MTPEGNLRLTIEGITFLTTSPSIPLGEGFFFLRKSLIIPED
jgi:hypothetical protein